jgi:DNA polymerase-1
MPLALIADTETDGFLDTVSKLHSIVLRDADSGEIVLSCADTEGYQPLNKGLALMEKADLLIGHNWLTYDAPVLHKLRPDFRPRGKVFDSLVVSRVAWPTDRLKDADFKLQKKGKLPTNMIGRHSIEAWGHRLGVAKVGTDIADWSTWTPYMHERCESDTKVNWLLYKHLIAQGVPEGVLDVEHQVAAILARQERRGFYFDMKAAEDLQRDLQKRQAELDGELRKAFQPWEVRTPFTPKVNNKKMGYVKGVPTEKVKTIVFNPASRDHIADRLIALRGWKPKAFTNTGKPQVDESTIGELAYPEAKLLTEYLMVGKRLGQLCEGKEALMKHVKEDGRIHGSVNPNGANTYRMTHSRPNMAQVPSLRAAYGKQFRALLMAGSALMLVGADADALELRCLAGYMAAYDGGAYIKTVLEGKKEDGTDIHSVNARALGLDPKKTYPIDGQMKSGRDIAKVWFYAFIYGAGDIKLGIILGVIGEAKQRKAGAASRARFLKELPALGKLVTAVKRVLKQRGHLNAIDKRKLFARSEHAALNTLLQSAGAIFMKYALVILDETLQAAGLVPGVDYEFVANVHDEWQIECKEEHAEFIGKKACASIVTAGERLSFRCPLAGAYSVGKTWADTH